MLEMSESSNVLIVSECCSRLCATLTVCKAVDLCACLTIDRSSAPVMLIKVTSIVIVTKLINNVTTLPTTALYRACLVIGLAMAIFVSVENIPRMPANILPNVIFVFLVLTCTSTTRLLVPTLLPAKRSVLMKVIVVQPEVTW